MIFSTEIIGVAVTQLSKFNNAYAEVMVWQMRRIAK